MSLDDLFCDVDDFCHLFLPDWHRQQLQYGERNHLRGCRRVLSEIMTILIHFHQSHYRDFKAYYWLHLCRHLTGAFPKRLSDNRLVALIPYRTGPPVGLSPAPERAGYRDRRDRRHVPGGVP